MNNFNDATFPPHNTWDRRLAEIACPTLSPVMEVHENPWFTVNNRGGYFTTEYHLGQVVVLPVVNDNSIAMVRVRRPVIDDRPLELPAGGVEEGEQAEVGAAREFSEETGILIADVSRFLPLAPLAVSSTRMPRLTHVFRVDVSEEEYLNRGPHDDEVVSVERIPIQELPRLMSSGRIYVSVTLAVLGVFISMRLRSPDLMETCQP